MRKSGAQGNKAGGSLTMRTHTIVGTLPQDQEQGSQFSRGGMLEQKGPGSEVRSNPCGHHKL